MPSSLNKILVIQTASIGDVILATALIESLHEALPAAEIHFLAKKGMENLFSGHPYLKKVHIWDKSGSKYRNMFRLIRVIRREKFDITVNVQRFFSSGLITVLSGARITSGFAKNPLSRLFSLKVAHDIGSGTHETVRNYRLIGWIRGTTLKTPALYPPESDVEKIRQYSDKAFVTIAPASLWFTKQYPEDRWVEFIKQVPESYTVILLGSPADTELCQRIIQASGRQALNLSGKLSLLQSAALMKLSVMNFVNDSAPLHLASAVDAPVRAVFCSTVKEFGFGPLSGDAKVIETTQELPCRPCGWHGHPKCPEGHFDCAYTIRTDQLLQDL